MEGLVEACGGRWRHDGIKEERRCLQRRSLSRVACERKGSGYGMVGGKELLELLWRHETSG